MNGIINIIETECPRGLLKRYTVREYLILEDARSVSYVQVSGNYGLWSPKGVFIRDSWVSPRRYESLGETSFIVMLEVADKTKIKDMEESVDLLKTLYNSIEKVSVY